MQSNFDLLKAYFRVGNLPTELTLLHHMLFAAKHSEFRGTVPDSWAKIHGPRLGADLRLPSPRQPVAIEDDVSCVMLWNADGEERIGIGTKIGYLQAQRVNLDGVLILPLGDEAAVSKAQQMIAAWTKSIKLDWGILMNLRHDPGRGPCGHVGGIVPIGTYVVDPDTGQLAFERRNLELLNDICRQLPNWRPLPEAQRPYFDEDYCREIMRAVIHAVHQFALS